MISKSATQILQDRAAAANANRAAMPIVTAFLDEMRLTFPDARIKFASEGGRTLGTQRQWHEVASSELPLQQHNAQDKPSPTKGKAIWELKQKPLSI